MRQAGILRYAHSLGFVDSWAKLSIRRFGETFLFWVCSVAAKVGVERGLGC